MRPVNAHASCDSVTVPHVAQSLQGVEQHNRPSQLVTKSIKIKRLLFQLCVPKVGWPNHCTSYLFDNNVILQEIDIVFRASI